MNMRVCRLKNRIVLSFIHSFDWLGGGGRLGLGAFLFFYAQHSVSPNLSNDSYFG